jgi:hypothetical protein
VEEAVRGLSTLPLWLQIIGFVVAVLSGIVGTVLGVLNLLLRWRDAMPRLSVEAKADPDYRRKLELVVRNKGRVAAKVSNLGARITHPTEDPLTWRSSEPPYRLEPGDLRKVSMDLPLISSGLVKARPIGDEHTVIVTVEDGLGNQHESNPVRTNLWTR